MYAFPKSSSSYMYDSPRDVRHASKKWPLTCESCPITWHMQNLENKNTVYQMRLFRDLVHRKTETNSFQVKSKSLKTPLKHSNDF